MFQREKLCLKKTKKKKKRQTREGGCDEKLFQYSKYWSIYLCVSVFACLVRVPIPCVQAQRRRGHCASSFPLEAGFLSDLNPELTLCQLSWKAASSSNSAPSTHLRAGVIGICGEVLFVRWVLGSELCSHDFRSNALNC